MMTSTLRKLLLCCRVSLLKGICNPRTITIAALILAFLSFHLSSLARFSSAVGIGVTPWGFSHLLSPTMLILYGVLTILLFCDAPFFDEQTYYSLVRTGRFNWVLGQIFYIVLMSLIYSVFFWFCSVIVLLPNVEMSADWGNILKTLAIEPSIASRYGYNIGLFVDFTIISEFSAIEATAASIGLMWLNSAFLGVLIFTCNLVFRRFCGLIVAGFFVCAAYFAFFLGSISIGDWLGFFSPVSWASMLYLNFGYPGIHYPPLLYAICCQVGAIVVMSAVSIVFFCKHDAYDAERL